LRGLDAIFFRFSFHDDQREDEWRPISYLIRRGPEDESKRLTEACVRGVENRVFRDSVNIVKLHGVRSGGCPSI
jgi:hypothetical protein